MEGAIVGAIGVGMQVSPVNDGPVTFWLQVAPKCTSHLSEIKPHGWANHRIHDNQRGEHETLE